MLLFVFHTRLTKCRAAVQEVLHWAAPDRVNYSEAVSLLSSDGKPIQVGESFGPT